MTNAKKLFALLILICICLCSCNTREIKTTTDIKYLENEYQIIKIIILSDGNIKELEGKKAIEYLSKHKETSLHKTICLNKINNINEPYCIKIPYCCRYKYIENKRNNNFHLQNKKRRISVYRENQTCVTQTINFDYDIKEASEIYPHVNNKFKKVIFNKLGKNWKSSFKSSRSLDINIKPYKSVFIEFYPIVKMSSGEVQKYFVTDILDSKKNIIVKNKEIVAYSPKLSYVKELDKYLIDGVYIIKGS